MSADRSTGTTTRTRLFAAEGWKYTEADGWTYSTRSTLLVPTDVTRDVRTDVTRDECTLKQLP